MLKWEVACKDVYEKLVKSTNMRAAREMGLSWSSRKS